MQPQSFIFMGRYGAGKGTQANLLMSKLKKKGEPFLYIETGKEFRNFSAENNFTAKLTKKIIDSGGLMPEYMCVYMWGRLVAEKFNGAEHLVFDGTPRKRLEAQMLEELFPFNSLPKPNVIYLDVEHGESHRRLSIRAKSSGRADDTGEAIEKRKEAYEKDIVPTIEYYRKDQKVNFLDIDGERTIEEIHADIVQRLGL